MYENITFEMADIHNAISATNTIHISERDTLMHRWRYPSLSLHGIEGAFYSSGAKTVIPAKISGKFSIRLVPDQDPEKITKYVKDYVTAEFQKLKSKNSMKLECGHGAKAWVADVNHWNFGKFHFCFYFFILFFCVFLNFPHPPTFSFNTKNPPHSRYSVAAAKATEIVYKVKPDYTREVRIEYFL